jgi:hypothetical protein
MVLLLSRVIIKLKHMSVNLLQQVQQFLGYPELKKIDPNTGSVDTDNNTGTNLFSQAAIPAVLTALYKYVQSDDGAEEVLRGEPSTDWAGKIFHDNKQEAVTKIRSYAGAEAANATVKMNEIAATAVRIVKSNLSEPATIKEVKSFFLNQRNNILPFLPPDLKLGDLLHDDTVDDNVNKMEGPISSLMNSIGSAFSNPVTNDEVKKQGSL